MSASLAELQKRIQEAIISPDAPCPKFIKAPPSETADTMFGVYQNAYKLRLTEFLANDYEKLRFLLGDAQFRAMAHAYIAATPSDQPNARWYGHKLPEFLATHAPYSQRPLLHDLALLERAINDAFDAPDERAFMFEDLGRLAGERFGEAMLEFHPSVSFLTVTSDLPALWAMLGQDSPQQGDSAQAGACAGRINSAAASEQAENDVASLAARFSAKDLNLLLPAPRTMLVWRQDYASKFRLLEPEEVMALKSAREAVPFGTICEMIAVMSDPETAAMRAATYLRGWIEGEMVVSIALAETEITS